MSRNDLNLSYESKIIIDGFNPETKYYNIVERLQPVALYCVRSSPCKERALTHVKESPLLQCISVKYDVNKGLWYIPDIKDSDFRYFLLESEANKYWSELQGRKEGLF